MSNAPTPVAREAHPADGRPSRYRAVFHTLVTAAAVVAVVVFVHFGRFPLPLSLGQAIVAVVAVSTAVEAVRWARRGVRRQARRTLARMIVEYGGGIYGTIAVATWAYLQAMDVYGEIVAAGSLTAFFASLSLGWLIAEAIEGVRFGITALLWPWYWFSATEFPHAWLVAAVVWGADGIRKPLRQRLAAGRGGSVPADHESDGAREAAASKPAVGRAEAG